MIEDVTSIEVSYDADAYNRKIEGEYGEEVINESLEDLILSFDISISMDVHDFEDALMYISDMMKMNLKFERVGLSYWTSDYYNVRPKSMGPSKLYNAAKSNCPSDHRTTPLTSLINSLMDFRGANPNLIIVFTDGELQGDMYSLSKRQLQWYKKNRRKILWVLKRNSSQVGRRWIRDFDPEAYSKRTVLMK